MPISQQAWQRKQGYLVDREIKACQNLQTKIIQEVSFLSIHFGAQR